MTKLSPGVEPYPGFEWLQEEWHQDLQAITKGQTRFSEDLPEEALAQRSAAGRMGGNAKWAKHRARRQPEP